MTVFLGIALPSAFFAGIVFTLFSCALIAGGVAVGKRLRRR